MAAKDQNSALAAGTLGAELELCPRGSVSRVGWTAGAGQAHFPAWDCGPAFEQSSCAGHSPFYPPLSLVFR